MSQSVGLSVLASDSSPVIAKKVKEGFSSNVIIENALLCSTYF